MPHGPAPTATVVLVNDTAGRQSATMQVFDTQSASTVHLSALAHGAHAPPQSTSLSLPSLILLLQIGPRSGGGLRSGGGNRSSTITWSGGIARSGGCEKSTRNGRSKVVGRSVPAPASSDVPPVFPSSQPGAPANAMDTSTETSTETSTVSPRLRCALFISILPLSWPTYNQLSAHSVEAQVKGMVKTKRPGRQRAPPGPRSNAVPLRFDDHAVGRELEVARIGRVVQTSGEVDRHAVPVVAAGDDAVGADGEAVGRARADRHHRRVFGVRLRR